MIKSFSLKVECKGWIYFLKFASIKQNKEAYAPFLEFIKTYETIPNDKLRWNIPQKYQIFSHKKLLVFFIQNSPENHNLKTIFLNLADIFRKPIFTEPLYFTYP